MPQEWALSLTDDLARYMVSRFNALLSTDTDPPYTGDPNLRISVEALCEADRMVSILAESYRNKGAVFYPCIAMIISQRFH
jgi:zona occludens toxin (predicted ATPase)